MHFATHLDNSYCFEHRCRVGLYCGFCDYLDGRGIRDSTSKNQECNPESRSNFKCCYKSLKTGLSYVVPDYATLWFWDKTEGKEKHWEEACSKDLWGKVEHTVDIRL